MKNVHKRNHNGTLPRTYDKGKDCLDMIAISKTINDQAIKRCGMLPFYETMPSDHCALYCDIDVDHIFSQVNVDPTKHTFKKFTTDKAHLTDKYLKNWKNI